MGLRYTVKIIGKMLGDAGFRFIILSNRGFYSRMNDEEYIKKAFKMCMGRALELENPQTFNEKLQWLKLYNRKEEYTRLADKYLVRNYVREKLGEEYLIPLRGVWNSPEEIAFEALPEQFVLKCNHNSGRGMCICRDKNSLDADKVRDGLQKGLEQDYYLVCREWPYKNISRKIIAEQYISDSNGEPPTDYKFFCFNGHMKFFKIDMDRFTKHRANYYSANGTLLEFGEEVCPADFGRQPVIPKNLKEMISCAEKLSEGIPFVRIDMYNVDGKIYFGEMTFFPGAGLGKFQPEEWDLRIGQMLELPEKSK